MNQSKQVTMSMFGPKGGKKASDISDRVIHPILDDQLYFEIVPLELRPNNFEGLKEIASETRTYVVTGAIFITCSNDGKALARFISDETPTQAEQQIVNGRINDAIKIYEKEQ